MVFLKLLGAIDEFIEKISKGLILLSIFLMLTLTVCSIVLRWGQISFPWIDPFVRHLVFLTAFLGGVLATGKGTHIGIDVLSKYFEEKKKFKLMKFQRSFITLVSFIGTAWLCYASYLLTVIEFEYGKPGFMNIHSGFLVSIIPFGLALISYRFFYKFCETLFIKRGEN